MHILSILFFFLIKRTEASHREQEGLIGPILRFHLENYARFVIQEKKEYIYVPIGVFLSLIWIERSKEQYLGNCLALYLLNTSAYWW